MHKFPSNYFKGVIINSVILPSGSIVTDETTGKVYIHNGITPGGNQLTALPNASTAQLFGGTGSAGTAIPITLGTGLSLSGNTLNASVSAAAGAIVLSGTASFAAGQTFLSINKTSGSATALTLPASPILWIKYTVKDGKGDAATNNITVTPASGLIDGSSNYVMNTNRQSIDLIHDGTNWNLV